MRPASPLSTLGGVFWFQKMVQENQAQWILNILIAEDPLLMNIFNDVQIGLKAIVAEAVCSHCAGAKFRLGRRF